MSLSCRAMVGASTQRKDVPIYLDFAISGASVGTATAFTNPIDVCKTRMQLRGASLPDGPRCVQGKVHWQGLGEQGSDVGPHTAGHRACSGRRQRSCATRAPVHSPAA